VEKIWIRGVLEVSRSGECIPFVDAPLLTVRRPSHSPLIIATRFYVNEWQIIGKETAWCSRLPLSLSLSLSLCDSPRSLQLSQSHWYFRLFSLDTAISLGIHVRTRIHQMRLWLSPRVQTPRKLVTPIIGDQCKIDEPLQPRSQVTSSSCFRFRDSCSSSVTRRWDGTCKETHVLR